ASRQNSSPDRSSFPGQSSVSSPPSELVLPSYNIRPAPKPQLSASSSSYSFCTCGITAAECRRAAFSLPDSPLAWHRQDHPTKISQTLNSFSPLFVSCYNSHNPSSKERAAFMKLRKLSLSLSALSLIAVIPAFAQATGAPRSN